jgi:DNA-binding transcriptional ArsR family regulator
MSDRLGRLLVHPLRHRLLLEYAAEPDNPSSVADRLGEPLNLVAYHTGILLRHGLVELVRTERRHGALTRLYRSTVRLVIEDAQWEALPTPIRRALAFGTISMVADDARRAAFSGGFDATDAHVSRIPLNLDEQGRRDVAHRLRTAYDELAAIVAGGRERTGSDARTYEIVMLGFDLEDEIGS